MFYGYKIIILGLLVMALLSGAASVIAQDSGGFVTNTPAPGIAPTITPTPQVRGSVSSYGLRFWIERDFLDLLVEHIQGVEADNPDTQVAAEVLHYELGRRFPEAPRDFAQLERLFNAMVRAPRGTVDLRMIIRPYMQVVLNSEGDGARSFEFDDFRIELRDANFNADGLADALVHIVYPADATDRDAIKYEDFLLALRDEDGNFRVMGTDPDIPAFPLNGVEGLELQQLRDVNRDGLDEAILVVDDGELNQRLLILGVRGGMVADLTPLNTEIRYGEIVDWDLDDAEPILSVLVFRREPSFWHCISELAVGWQYDRNFYRSRIGLNAQFENQESLGCELAEAERIFALPPEEGIELLEGLLEKYSADEPDTARAKVVLATLYALNGQFLLARQTARSAQRGTDDDWVMSQSDALLALLEVAGRTQLEICAALARANEDAACNLRDFLARYLTEKRFFVDQPLADQLEESGLEIAAMSEIVEVGRRDRTVTQFALPGSGWWAFISQPDGEYLVEPVGPPFDAETPSVTGSIGDIDEQLVAILLNDNDPSGALNSVRNYLLRNPDASLSPQARYLAALSYELTGERARAIETYFELWSAFPGTIWGELAGQHIERR